MNCLTHFEIYGDEPSDLENFYAKVFGWEVEQMPGIAYWRINTGSVEAEQLNGGLSHRALPDLNGWLLYVQVPLLDETAELIKSLGGSIVQAPSLVPASNVEG